MPTTVFGTELQLTTFIIICIEFGLLMFMLVFDAARKNHFLNSIFLVLLLIYNVTGGLFPDPEFTGIPIQTQNLIAYATGFITPCFFPFYLYKSFQIEAIKEHAYKWVFLFLGGGYLTFATVYLSTGNLNTANYALIITLLYAIYFAFLLIKSFKSNNTLRGQKKMKLLIFTVSVLAWVSLPLITIAAAPQYVEALATNSSMILLMALEIVYFTSEIKKLNTHLNLTNTEIKEELLKNANELNQIYHNQANVFINIAHEIKTPLTIVMNYVHDIMPRYKDDEEIQIIKLNLDKILADILNYFDLIKKEKGNRIYSRSSQYDISKCVREKSELFKCLCRKNRLKIALEIEPNVNVQAPEQALDRIIYNLVDNAVKFSPPGSTIIISVISTPKKAVLKIIDEGTGISDANKETIFIPYVQMYNNGKKNSGLGLGLPIVKKILDDLDGDIEVRDNEKGKGTMFVVTIPLSAQKTILKNEISFEPKEEVIVSEPASKEMLPNILLIEDNTDFLDYLTEKLKEDYNIQFATNADDAFAIINNFETMPDLLITDIMLPEGRSGVEIIEYVKSIEALKKIPIIAMSAKDDFMKDIESGLVDASFKKPFYVESLLKEIQRIICIEDAYVEYNGFYIPQSMTKRQIEVTKLLLDKLSARKIAEQLVVAESTANRHIANIYKHLNVKSRVELFSILSEKSFSTCKL